MIRRQIVKLVKNPIPAIIVKLKRKLPFLNIFRRCACGCSSPKLWALPTTEKKKFPHTETTCFASSTRKHEQSVKGISKSQCNYPIYTIPLFLLYYYFFHTYKLSKLNSNLYWHLSATSDYYHSSEAFLFFYRLWFGICSFFTHTNAYTHNKK